MTDLQRRPPSGGQLPPPDRHHHVPGPPPAPEGQRDPASALAPLFIVVALLLALGYFGSWWWTFTVLALVVIIFLHELGHFVMARRAGMKVTEFFLGFGPRIWSFRRGEVEYGLKAIPAGAYVRIIGMNNLEEVPPEDEPRTYRQKGYWSRLSVAVAGSAMHFLLAIALLVATLGFFGVQRPSAWKISGVSDDSPALAAGLHSGDRIMSVDGTQVATFADLTDQVRARPGQTVTLVVQHPDRATETVTAHLAAHNPQGEAVGFLGIGETRDYVKESVPAAAVGSVQEFGRISWASVAGLAKVFSPSGIRGYVDALTNKPTTSGSGGGDNRLVTVVGVPRLAEQAAHNGIADLLILLAVINISLGLLNMIPLLPFDGGHVAIATYEAIRSRRGKRYYADITKMLPASYIALAAIALVVMGSLYLDIAKPIGG
jgi:membrane-associated protease RseP (regulator of RpoE activity)